MRFKRVTVIENYSSSHCGALNLFGSSLFLDDSVVSNVSRFAGMEYSAGVRCGTCGVGLGCSLSAACGSAVRINQGLLSCPGLPGREEGWWQGLRCRRCGRQLAAQHGHCLCSSVPHPNAVKTSQCPTALQHLRAQNTAALFGGAIIAQHSLVNATNTKLVGNRAIWAGGGALKLMSAVGLLKNCEVRDNRAVFGGGIEVRAQGGRRQAAAENGALAACLFSSASQSADSCAALTVLLCSHSWPLMHRSRALTRMQRLAPTKSTCPPSSRSMCVLGCRMQARDVTVFFLQSLVALHRTLSSTYPIAPPQDTIIDGNVASKEGGAFFVLNGDTIAFINATVSNNVRCRLPALLRIKDGQAVCFLTLPSLQHCSLHIPAFPCPQIAGSRGGGGWTNAYNPAQLIMSKFQGNSAENGGGLYAGGNAT